MTTKKQQIGILTDALDYFLGRQKSLKRELRESRADLDRLADENERLVFENEMLRKKLEHKIGVFDGAEKEQLLAENKKLFERAESMRRFFEEEYHKREEAEKALAKEKDRIKILQSLFTPFSKIERERVTYPFQLRINDLEKQVKALERLRDNLAKSRKENKE